MQTYVLCLSDTGGLRLVRCSPLEVTRTVSTGSVDCGMAIDRAVFLLSGDHVSVLVDFNTFGCHTDLAFGCSAVHDSLSRALHDLQFPALAANPLEPVEVVVVHRRDVLAAEHSNFEFLGCIVPRRERSTRRLEITQSLVDDCIRTDLFGNLGRRPVVSNKLRRRGQVDSVDVGVPGVKLAQNW